MKLDWRGLIAAIMAAGLAVALVMAIAGLIMEKRQISEKGAEVMVAICVAMVAAISTYLASRNDK